MRKWNLSLVFSALALGTALVAVYGVYFNEPHDHFSNEDQFTSKLLTHVRSCIAFDDELGNKQEILSLVDSLEADRTIVETGSDDLRSKYVFSQGCIEHVLACAQALGDIDQLIGVIHTPTVATPLCIVPGGEIEGVLDSSIRHDLAKLLTVRSRAQIVREYLTKGGKLYVVYPEGGQALRTPAQLEIYQRELRNFPDRLIDWTLSCASIDPDKVGATYFFRTPQRKVFAFSIKSRQAIDIQHQAEWGLWLGSVEDPQVSGRVNEIMDYLSAHDGPDLRSEVI